MIKPSFSEFKELSLQGNLIPLYEEFPLESETPISAFLKMENGSFSFLLESMESVGRWGRYTFIGTDPSILFRSKGRWFEVIKEGFTILSGEERDPLAILEGILSRYRPVYHGDLPRFFGGAVGYVSYDYIRCLERIPDSHPSDPSLFDCCFMIADNVFVFDHLKRRLLVIANAFLDEKKELEEVFEEARERIKGLRNRLKNNFPLPLENNIRLLSPFRSNLSKGEFMEIVKRAKGYIERGDVLQVVLSQRFSVEMEGDPFKIYRVLRLLNPSPYLFYLKMGDGVLLGSSPEVMVRVEKDKMELRPLAGTRPRGKTPEEDLALERELVGNEKERAEHVMLVDLGRNDLGRVAEVGSVKVTELMGVERYSHVMHLVSTIEGRLSSGKNAFDVFRAAFPAGTVSGAPKIRAMEIIEELEPVRRGPYAGAVGYFSFSGDMDTCICIRSVLIKNGMAYIQTGAGIVADSEPEKEHEETLNKARALFKAIEIAGGCDDPCD